MQKWLPKLPRMALGVDLGRESESKDCQVLCLSQNIHC